MALPWWIRRGGGVATAASLVGFTFFMGGWLFVEAAHAEDCRLSCSSIESAESWDAAAPMVAFISVGAAPFLALALLGTAGAYSRSRVQRAPGFPAEAGAGPPPSLRAAFRALAVLAAIGAFGSLSGIFFVRLGDEEVAASWTFAIPPMVALSLCLGVLLLAVRAMKRAKEDESVLKPGGGAAPTFTPARR